jgi:hypothetical protein
MRMARLAAKAVVGIALVPGLAFAQANESAKYFNDSWFWGLNGGAMFLTTGYDSDVKVTAPSVGGEWLITRTRIGLRIAIDQAFFDEQTAVFDPSTSGGARLIQVKDWRRYSAEVYFFPFPNAGMLRWYAGLGLSLNVLQNATPMGSFSSEAQMDTVFTLVNEWSSRVSPTFTMGLQAGFGRGALFVQGSGMPTRNNFLLNRSAYTFMVQGGLRYNIGSAIEKF